MCKVLKFFLNPLQLQSILPPHPPALLTDAENTNVQMKSSFSMVLARCHCWGHSSYMFLSKHNQDMMFTQGRDHCQQEGNLMLLGQNGC